VQIRAICGELKKKNMIPIQLTIQGLYSYQKKQTIDFKTLTDANLFGIFGSVGSGKSSVLEAITFALYGKTERLNLSGDNRNYNMMNLKSNELLIDFIFETGKNQTAFRAVVSGKRNSKQFEEVKKLDRIAYKKTESNWIPIEPAMLENAIGLSYENFKRTIIIPQGQFQEFLQLGNTERTRMMTQLFGLEKFELYYKTVSLETKNNAQKQNLQGQLQQLGVIDPNQITEFETQLLQLKNILDELEDKLKKLQIKEAQFQQIQELAKKLEISKITLEALQKQEPDFIELEKTMLQYERCVLQFKNLFDALETSTKKVADKIKQIEMDSLKLEKEEDEITKNELVLNEIKPAYENRDKLKQRAEELEKLLQIKNLDIIISDENERLSKGNKIVLGTIEKIDTLTREKQILSEKIKSQKAELPDFAMLSKIKTWHIEKQNIDKSREQINTELSKYQLEIENENHLIDRILETPLFDEFVGNKEFSEILNFAQSKIESLKNALKNLDSEAGHLRVKAQLEKYAADLSDGLPCPLCGSTHHPEIYSAADISQEQTKISAEKLSIEKQIEKWNETILTLKDLNIQLNLKKGILSDWQKKLEENTKQATLHQSLFIWPEFEEIQNIESAFNSAEILQKEIKLNETNLEKINDELEKAIKNKERFQTELEKIQTQFTIHQTEKKTLLEQLKLVSAEDFLNKTVSEIESEKMELLNTFSGLEKQFGEISAKLTELRKSKDTLSGILSANREVLKSEKENLENLQLKLDMELKKTGYSNLDEVKTILSQAINLEENKKKVNDFKQGISLAKSRFEEIKTEMGDRIYNAEAHQKLLVEIKESKELQNTKNQEKGKAEEWLKKLLSDLQKQALLTKQMEKTELRGQNINTMKSLFKASGFVNYISSVYLQNLCNAANDRFFKLTRQKLSLEITTDNNFQVRDFLNGGKVRNVKTLSGGQTFQAALSLALALADNIQKITESNQNFFFLDEGFGSLDKESLSIVFDTLKSLRKENRIVGVISHVEEMQQEIDVHLRIENKDETGSLIFESWAG
jgi:exonuclease SbcC